MRFSQIGVIAALAGVSQSFLLPPTISETDSKIVDVIPFEAEAITDGRVMEINCPGCPVQTTEEGTMHWGNAESVLRLNFTVSHCGFDKLLMNGLQIFPIDPKAINFLTPLVADQLIKAPDNTWAYSSSPKLGYSLSVKHLGETGKDHLGLIAVHLEIMEVADKFIDGIPAVELKLVRTPSGKLMIGDSQIQTPKSLVPSPADGNQECTTLLCKWKAIITGKVSALKKGCGSKDKSHGRPSGRPHGIKGGPNKFPHGRPHGTHRRPHHSAFGRFLRSVTLHIVVPILIGVVVGIAASLVGMVVGHICIFFWRLLFRRGERGQYCRVKQEESIENIDDESKGFLENQGPPPVYEDVIIVDEKTEQK